MAAETFEDDSSKQSAFSFKIKTKDKDNKILSSASNSFDTNEKESLENEEKEYIIATDNNEFKSSHKNKTPSKLIIPMIAKNRWLNDECNIGDDITQQAMKELMGEVESEKDTKEQEAIPLMMKNRLPPSKDGVTDERYDISIRPEESTMDDYQNIPVSSFGQAMLRGMGWNEKQPIGGVNKSVCQPIEYIPRHKGLGLGAEKKADQHPSKRKRKLGDPVDGDKKYTPIVEEDGRVRHIKRVGEDVPENTNDFIPGKCVIILKNPHKDLYGKIISVDDDTSRISVKLSLSGDIIQLSQFHTQLVDKIPAHNDKVLKSSSSKEKDSERYMKKQRTNETNGACSPSKQQQQQHWLQSNIRVRIISRSFRGGKYYNKKAKILDVVSIDTCTCKTEEGKILDDVNELCLETVISKSKGSYLMILNGKYKGKLAKLIERNKTECVATVQLISNKHVTKVSFDDMAEFTGQLPDDEFL